MLNVLASGSRNWAFHYNFQKPITIVRHVVMRATGVLQNHPFSKARLRVEKIRNLLFDVKNPEEAV